MSKVDVPENQLKTQKLKHLRVVKWRLNIDLAFMKTVDGC